MHVVFGLVKSWFILQRKVPELMQAFLNLALSKASSVKFGASPNISSLMIANLVHIYTQ